MRVGRNLRLAHALQSHHVFKSERAPGLRQRKAAQKENQYARPHGNSSKADKCSGLGMQGVCEENHASSSVAQLRMTKVNEGAANSGTTLLIFLLPRCSICGTECPTPGNLPGWCASGSRFFGGRRRQFWLPGRAVLPGYGG